MELLNRLGEASFSYLATFLIQTAAVLVAGFLVAAALKKHGPVIQSHVHRTTLIACLLLLLAPVIPVRQPQPRYRISTDSVKRISFQQIVNIPVAAPISKGLPAAATPAVQKTPAEPHDQRSGIRLSIAGFFGAAWIVGAAFQLLLIAVGWAQLAILRRRSASVLSHDLLSLVQRLSTRLGAKRPLVRESQWVRTPFLAGVRRPTIYLPVNYAQTVDAETLEMTLLHELAHVRRADCVWTIGRRVLTAILWMQPLAWVFARHAEQANEEAADLIAISYGISKTQYANCLLRLAAANLAPPRSHITAVGIAESPSSIGGRIEKILGPAERAVRRVSAKLRLGSLGAALGIPLALTSFVVFTGDSPAIVKILSRNFTAADPQPWTPPPGYQAHFHLARQQGWPMQLARYSAYTQEGRKHGRLSSTDRQTVVDVNAITHPETNVFYGDSKPPREKLNKLVAYVSNHPGRFYAEYSLATEYLLQRDFANYSKFYSASLRHAPVILASRLQFEDGHPLQNAGNLGCLLTLPNEPHISGRSSDGTPFDLQLSLGYGVALDGEGCFYIPAFRSDTFANGLSYSYGKNSPIGNNTIQDYVNTAGTADLSSGMLVLLPPHILRPRIQLQVPGGSMGTLQNPVVASGKEITITWKPVPRAVRYSFQISEGYRDSAVSTSGGSADLSPKDTAKASVTLPLGSPDMPFWFGMSYGLVVSAYDATGLCLTSSDTAWIAKSAPLRSPALNEANIKTILPPDIKFSSLTHLPGGKLKIDLISRGPETWKQTDLLSRRFRIFGRYRSSLGTWTSTSVGSVTRHTITL